MEPDEKTIKQIAATIRHVAKQVRRDKDLEQGNLLSLSKLTHAYGTLLAQCKEEEPWNFEEFGDPDYFTRLEQQDKDKIEKTNSGKKLIRRRKNE
jgi:hypothetical protein